MEQLDVALLVTLAAEKLGSKAEVARYLGVTPGRLNEFERGKRKIQPDDVALLAHIAGQNPEQWLARATVWANAGTPKGERLACALGKFLQATGAAVVTVGVAVLLGFTSQPAAAAKNSGTDSTPGPLGRHSTMYRKISAFIRQMAYKAA